MELKSKLQSGLYALIATAVVTFLWWWMVSDILGVISLSLFTFPLLFYGFQVQRRFIHRDQLRSLSFYFMNQFILTLSVKTSIASTLSELYPSLHPRIQRALDEDEGLPAMDTLKRLEVIFDFPLYAIFIHMIDIHVHYGGSIIDMTDMLLSRARREEIEWNEKRMYIKKKWGQFFLLWLLNLIMLFFVRFGLSEVFKDVFPTVIFKGLLAFFFLIFVFSLLLFFEKAYGGKIRVSE
jgi:hypothetical protein